MNVNHQIEELSYRVRMQRKLQNLTHIDVVELSREAGWPVSQPTLSKIESMEIATVPGTGILLGLSYALKSSPNDLLGFESPHAVSSGEPLAPDVKRIAELMDKMTMEQRADVVRFAEHVKTMSEHAEQIAMLKRNQNHAYVKNLLDNVTELPAATQRSVLEALQRAGLAGGKSSEREERTADRLLV